tara:strand:- start:19187 stop:20365 length:1179 start_codon:yes stop_codon:yes gene_type:complete
MKDKEKAIKEFAVRSKILKKSLQKALPLVGRNPVLMEPRYMAMIVAIFAEDDPVMAKEFNQFLRETGSLNVHDKEELDKLFWGWIKHKYPEKFKPKKVEVESAPGEVSLQRLGEALREELEEKFEMKSKIKIQHAKDEIRRELTEVFNAKIKEVMKNTGQTTQSLNSMDAIIEKAGKGALDLLSDKIESAKGSTNRIQNSAEDLQKKVKKLEEEIQYDTIPGLYTVQIFSQRFQDMANKFNGSNIPFSLVFLTIDNLEHYSSSSDPMISRKLVLGVAQLIIEELQNHSPDILPARYDANLMGFLLPNTGLKDASSFIDQIRDMIKKEEYTDKGGHSLELTVSAGVAQYADSDSFEFEEIPGGGKQLNSTIFARAIGLLKKAQSKGGNRVEQQ